MRRLAFVLALACVAPSAPPEWPPLPSTVPSVLGPVPVRVTPDLRLGKEPLMGSWSSYARVIRVRAGIAPAAQWQALEHERVHMELWDAGVVIGDEELEDRICDAVATARVREMRR
jgi:hypothetical protein